MSAWAHNAPIEAMDMADQLKADGIAAAKENIAKLTELTKEMEARNSSLREPVARWLEAGA